MKIVLGIGAAIVLLIVVAMMASGVSGYLTVVDASRKVVESFEAEGRFVSRTCNPNRTVMAKAQWNSLSRHHQDTLVRSLGTVCQADQHGAWDMQLVSAETGETLAQWDVQSDVVKRGPRP